VSYTEYSSNGSQRGSRNSIKVNHQPKKCREFAIT
jgi:hypothetical protein